MILFTDINHIILPESIFNRTFRILREYGRKYKESVCLWIGKKYEDRFTVSEIIVPNQKNSLIDYYVDSDEIDRINRILYEKKTAIIAQIHSHPNSAFHSETDDEFPIVTTLGGFSIVIPHFGFITESEWDDIKYYRLYHNGWRQLDNEEISSFITIQTGK